MVVAFGDWLQKQRLRVSTKSRLSEKLAHIPHDGRVEIGSNSIENLIRPVALNKKTPCLWVMRRAEKPGAASPR